VVVSNAARIVSLVPSLTELLCDLGLIEQLVGRTGFCVHPKEALRAVSKVGGTKTVDVARVRRLKPTHVIVNVDENEKSTVDQLREFVPNVVVTHPITVADNLDLYRLFGELFDVTADAAQLSERLRAEMTTTAADRFESRNVIYVIWQAPWMTISAQTYIASMLASVGLTTMQLPGQSQRYPSFDWPQFALEQCDAVLLSSEPFRFTAKHVDALTAELAALDAPQRAARGVSRTGPALVHLIDGEMTSWYGSRAISGLQYLRRFRQDMDSQWSN
jgi:ABC-type Fe3+-hydroxamate transport system substrate-binding protein